MRLLLASASPRRAALLAAAGFAFDVFPVDLDESHHAGEPVEAYVVRLALEKAAAAARQRTHAIVLGADTTVVAPDGRILGKPGDGDEAGEWLAALGGRAHRVLTGVALARGDRQVSAFDETVVYMRPLGPDEIAWYVASGEWRGKAGGYAIQGLASRFVERIEGSYGNVVGLPISTVIRLLRQIGADDRVLTSPDADKPDNR
ncbi:MAG TPA: Maf family protein [Vicinamibacterales bacterium]